MAETIKMVMGIIDIIIDHLFTISFYFFGANTDVYSSLKFKILRLTSREDTSQEILHMHHSLEYSLLRNY